MKAKDGVYGFDGHAVIADECWDLAPSAISDGAEPAMRHRISPQLVMTSTSHPRATSLMPSRISAALADEDGLTLLMLWAAAPGADLSDPATWRAASPYWTDEDDDLMAKGFAEASAKLPELDDPDPLGSWMAQHLNVWRLDDRRDKGDPLVSPEVWEELTEEQPDRAADAVAVESWWSEGVSVAYAWKEGVVHVDDYPDLASAAAVLKAEKVRRVIVGSSLAEDPSLAGLTVIKGTGRAPAVVQEARRLIAENALRHTDSEHLSNQVLAVRTAPSPDGVRLLSRGRIDGIKAVSWALGEARKPSVGKPRILMPSV